MAGPPIVDGIQSVFFYVADMNRALDFYHGLLGLPVLERSQSWSALECGGVRIGLHLAHDGGADARRDEPSDSGAIVSFRVADARAAQRRLDEAGSTVGAVNDEPFGFLVQLEDPDGHSLRLVQPKQA